MRDLLRDVLLLQPEWTPQNTPAMQTRGRLIRHDVAGWLRDRLPALEAAASGEVDDWLVEARDGTGLKAEIPWVRVYSASRSASATVGWYVVYLFEAEGDRVYLSLMQGATLWQNGEFRARPQAELRQRAKWARTELAAHLAERPDLVDEITLNVRKSQLGRAYEAGNVAAFEYRLDALPSEEVLGDDLDYLASVLGELYRLEAAPEVVDAVVEAEQMAGKARRGQGLRLNVEERVAIERRAVAVATSHLTGQGFVVEDVGATRSYDLDARRGDERVFVEVKGTTTVWSENSEIILTKNEVDLHLREYPNTMLVVVSRIKLDGATNPPSASGGELKVIHPWRIAEPNLTPVSYRYLVGN